MGDGDSIKQWIINVDEANILKQKMPSELSQLENTMPGFKVAKDRLTAPRCLIKQVTTAVPGLCSAVILRLIELSRNM